MPEIVSVIQLEGNPEAVVWKSPKEDFNSATQLIVDETHEAIVLIEGHAELFGTGRHTLDTQNYPFLTRIQRFATGGDTPFPCKVFFIKKNYSSDVQWGTRERIVVEDPKLNILLHLGMHGSVYYTIDNSLKFVEKFTGFAREFNPQDVVTKLRGIIVSRVKDSVAKIFINAGISYPEVSAHLTEIGEILQGQLDSYCEDFGIDLKEFVIDGINSSEDDIAEVRAAKSAARSMVINAQGQAQAREIQGFDWITERKADILHALASNEGSLGGMMGAGIGVMAMGPMGQNLTNVVDDLFDPNNAGKANPFPENGVGMAQPFGLDGAGSGNLADMIGRQPTLNQQAARDLGVTPPIPDNPLHDSIPGLQPDALAGQQNAGTMDQQFGAMPTMQPGANVSPTTPLYGQPAVNFGVPSPIEPDASAVISAPQTAPAPGSTKSPLERLQEAKTLLDARLISQEEFDAKKAEIMSVI